MILRMNAILKKPTIPKIKSPENPSCVFKPIAIEMPAINTHM
jgi:hypothetical protein